MPLDRILSHIEHPLALGSFRNWMRLLAQSNGIAPRFIPRVIFVSLTTLLSSPLRIIERARYAKTLRRENIHPSPIIIVGHWRTGTSLLHNLMCQDANLGYITTFQAMAPEFSLTGDRLIKPLLSAITHRIHPTRIIDNMPLSMDGPQEEDYAIACMSPYSFLHMFTFPCMAGHYFSQFALFEGLTDGVHNGWTQAYLDILRKATYYSGGKRLVLKSPSGSGHLLVILKLFPQAKFIHIVRNPYNVFLSMRNLFQSVIQRSQLQLVDHEQIDAFILQFYVRLMKKFIKDKKRIPPANIVEIKFEELESEPLSQIHQIYESLALPGFASSEQAFLTHIKSVNGYQKNKYKVDGEVIKKVNQHWGFAFDAWRYNRLQPVQTPPSE